MPEIIITAAVLLIIMIFVVKKVKSNIRDECERKISRIQADCENQKKLLRIEFEKEFATLTEESNNTIKNYNKEISNIRSEYGRKISTIRSEHKQEKESLRIKFENMLAVQTQNSSNAIANYNNAVSKITEKYKEQITNITENSNNTIANYDNTIKKLTNKYEEQICNITNNYEKQVSSLKQKIEKQNDFINNLKSNLTAFPYLAGIVADIETYGYEKLAGYLDWGSSKRRLDRVQDIREIRKSAKEQIEAAKEAQYQLQYLFQLYPALEDIIDCEFSELPQIELDEMSDRDKTRDFLSKEEWDTLSTTQKNQLALDRYFASHSKTKWQVGRDYENYIGYLYTKDGYEVDYFGSYMGVEDLGRDLIAKRGDKIHIVQCKYWSSKKVIREKHINQLYGTLISYCIENNIPKENVTGVLVTNIELSDMAKKTADFLGIKYREKIEKDVYPCIKCNVNFDSSGTKTKIYHLPFDQKYDVTKITRDDEFFALTVEEAESKGFRRAFKWFGN